MLNSQFEFKETFDDQEQMDFDRLSGCPRCGKPIPRNSTMCFYCGEEISFTSKTGSWKVWVTLFLIIIFVIVSLF